MKRIFAAETAEYFKGRLARGILCFYAVRKPQNY